MSARDMGTIDLPVGVSASVWIIGGVDGKYRRYAVSRYGSYAQVWLWHPDGGGWLHFGSVAETDDGFAVDTVDRILNGGV